MRLHIVIVNYRTPDLAIDSLRSLVGQLDAGTSVAIVDNCSGDDSVARLRRAIEENGWGDWVSLTALDRNDGFAAGNNAAIAPALASSDPPDYLLLLNPDTIVRSGAVCELLNFMDSHPKCGIAGSRLEEPQGDVQRSAFRFPSLAGDIEHSLRLGIVTRLLSRHVVAPPAPVELCQTDWVSGACMIVRRAVFSDCGLLDAKYFMYFEETDFCLAAHRAEWECWYVPSARVVHLAGASTQSPDDSRRRLPAYWFDSRRRYFLKSHGIVYTVLADLAFAIGYALWRVRRAIQRKPDVDPPMMLRDFLRHSVLIRGAG